MGQFSEIDDDGVPLASKQVVLDADLRFDSPVLDTLLHFWNGLRGEREMPTPGDVDPLDLPRNVLPHILLVDVRHDPILRFQWRLIGTHATSMLGRDMTGRYWDEIYDEPSFRRITTGLNWVLRHRLPVRTVGTAPYASKHFIRSESIIMPLSNDGPTINRLLGAVVYEVKPV